MAFDKAPNQVFPNMSLTDTTADPLDGNLVIPLRDFTQELTAVEADPVTGDSREILFSFLDHYARNFISRDQDERSVKATIDKRGSLQTDGEHRYTYTTNINTVIASEDIPDEPTT